MPRAARAGAILAAVFADWEYRHAVVRHLGNDGWFRRHERRKLRIGGKCSGEAKLASRMKGGAMLYFETDV